MRSSTWLALALALSLGCGTDSGVPAGLTLQRMDAAVPGDGGGAEDVGGGRAPSTCTDRDGDGFGEGCAAGVDCDDADPTATDGCYRCALPATDCACPEGAAPVACDVTNDRGTNESGTCHLGARRCAEGRWTRCEALRAPAFAVTTVAGCRGNCSPGCQRFVDCMSAGVIPGDCEGLVPGNAAPAVFCPTGSAPGGVRPQCDGAATGYDRGTSALPFVDACRAPGHLTLLAGARDAAAQDALPFDFPWFGSMQRTVTLHSAGALSFGAAGFVGDVSAPLAGAAADNTVFAFWDDLQLRDGVCTATFGVAPTRTWVAQWQRARFDAATDSSVLSFEVILSEADGAIDLAYLTMEGDATRASGSLATVGLRGGGATRIDQVAHRSAGAVRAGTRVRWTPRASAAACREGIYRQTFEARCDRAGDVPVWSTLIVGADVPAGSILRLQAQLAETEGAAATAAAVQLPSVPVGSVGAPVSIDLLPSIRVLTPSLATERLPFLRLQATLEASADGRAVPRLDGVELQYNCVPAEIVAPCSRDAACNPGSRCARGVVRCENSAGGRPLERCESTGFLPAGTACGTDRVCDGTGTCVACREGAACAVPGAPCATGRTQCNNGVPTCVARETAPIGSACGGSPRTYYRGSSTQSWDDACTAGTRLTLVPVTGGGWRVDLPLPLTVFGQERRQLWVSPQGALSFGAALAAGTNTTLPAGGVDAVFAFWDDLDAARPPCVAVVGPAYARRVVVTWSHTRFSDGSGDLDFEAVLHEGADAVDLLYRTMTGGGDRGSGGSATIGMQRADGAWFDLVGFNTAGVATAGTRVRWSPSVTAVCDAAARCVPCNPGAACSPDRLCALGTTSCDTGYPVCDVTGSRAPVPEACNGEDDDCDGVVDNGCRPCVESVGGATSQSGAVWQINRGAGPICWGATTPRHGDASEYQYTSIPPESDSSWLPHGNSISFADPSTLCGVCDCRRGGDFTHFQTSFRLPTGYRVDAMRVTMGQVDDGARLTIFNDAFPAGVVDPGSYAYYPAGNTTDLAAYLRTGRNRVVLTHVDDCCRDRVVAGVAVLLNNEPLRACGDLTQPTNCLPGWADCNASPWDGCETNLGTSSAHCGACGRACPSGAFCLAGACATGRCDNARRDGDETDVDCGGSCAPCGACRGCRTGNDCATGTCSMGQCTVRTEVSIDWVRSCTGAGGLNIPVERDLPAGRYLFTPMESAGTVWDTVRPPGSGWMWFVNCAGLPGTIPSSYTRWSTPAEAFAAVRGMTTTFDWAGGPLRCIFPDNPCTDNHGGVRFSLALQCSTPPPMQCTPGFADCDGAMDNGCETNTQTDGAHCGACGIRCVAASGATAACRAGACVQRCNDGRGDCDGDASNGCEVDLAASGAHCGACGNACAAGANETSTCTTGRCVRACVTGFADCDGDARNGCEVDLRGSPSNCGACGRVCSLPRATAGCAAAACTLVSCDAGWANCDGAAANGCESESARDPANCGACGVRCAVANGTPRCDGGRCGVASCNGGWADCDGSAANGCENDLLSDANCGACGRACGAGTACRAGACVSVCASGLTSCSGVCSNLRADNQNCGACGRVCPSGQQCTAGACALVCATGTADCDGNTANGCEADVRSSSANCGACGVRCASGYTCLAGRCESNACIPPASCAGASCPTVCSRVLFTEEWEGGTGAWGTPRGGGPIVTARDGSDCAGSFLRETELYAAGRVFTNAAIPVVGGRTYCLASWVRGSAGTQPFLGIRAGHWSGTEHWLLGRSCWNSGINNQPVGPIVSDDAWRWYGRQFTMPSTFTSVVLEVEIFSGGSAGTADFDGIQLIEGPCPQAPSRVCAGASCPTCPSGQANCGFGCTAVGASCSAGVGACARSGVTSCSYSGAGTTCGAVAGAPVAETCNGVDDNCNGAVDEAFGALGGSCSVGVGACARSGVNVCAADGSGVACNAVAGAPAAEACNNVDDNCNGAVDDGAAAACPARANATSTCSLGSCGFVCNAGFADCDGAAANGCEVDTRSSAGHCGACGRACAFANGVAACSASACALVACNSGYGDCDGNAANGCEVFLGSNLSHCGGCGRACSFAGASAACVGGACAIGSCNAGRANCNGVASDGCEVDSGTDANNCGGCGRSCGAGYACANGVCVGTGVLRFTMTWDRNADMDLHVTPPCGTEIYYGRLSACGGSLDRDDTVYTGPENIFWTSGAARGSYRVCVSPYRIPGAVNWVVRAFTGVTQLWEQRGTSTASTGVGCSHTYTFTY